MAWNYQFIARLPEDFKEEDILFLRQLGIPNAYLALPRDQHDHQSLKRIKEQIEAEELNLHMFTATVLPLIRPLPWGLRTEKGNWKHIWNFWRSWQVWG